MSFSFSIQKTTNVILFIVKSLGGRAEIQRLYLLLYFADTAHLAKHGGLITGDTYIAMKRGPAPINILNLYRQIRNAPFTKHVNGKPKLILSIDEHLHTVAHVDFDMSYLAVSEVAILFEVVHSLKETPLDILYAKARSKAWNDADPNGVIAPADMAEENGATPDMIRYINICYADEMSLFDTHEQAV